MSNSPSTGARQREPGFDWDGLASSLIADVAGPQYIMDGSIQPIWRPIRLSGPVFTVHMPGGDNLALHRALEAAPAGAVLVAVAASEFRCGVWGELMALAAKRRGISGLVTNAWVRDYEGLTALGFPVFARGLHIGQARKEVRGTLNETVRCGGVDVSGSDWIVADSDGIVVVPHGQLAKIHEQAREQEEREASVREDIKRGQLPMDVLRIRPEQR